MNLDYPNILAVTSSTFNPYTGTGILLSNLFKGWPTDKIAMAHSDNFYQDRNVCNYVYKMGSKEFSWVWPLHLFMKKAVGGRLSTTKLSPNNRSFSGSSVWVNSRLRLLYDQVNRLLGGQEVYLE